MRTAAPVDEFVDMTRAQAAQRIQEIATEAFSLLGTGQQVPPFSSRYPGFDLAEAYDVAAQVREMRAARGETAIGRKIGFTNRAVWGSYSISGPIWNYMFDSTVNDLAATNKTFTVKGLPEPRIEPEIILHLASAPHPEMSEDELLGCVDWIAHGFEVVHSIFPGWTFTAADAVAAYGVHGALLLGDKHLISEQPESWAKQLSSFTVELVRDDGISRRGHATHVLGGPLKALRFLVDELVRYPACEPLGPGELVTTGTLTEAMPTLGGQTWSTRLSGIDLQGLRLRLR
jgi:2-oxo-3-hexenedioate decarboxylase